MLKQIFHKAGFEIVGEAVNGREAIQLFEELTPDLVTMDMVMPEMGGMEALQAIRSRDHEAKVVTCPPSIRERTCWRRSVPGRPSTSSSRSTHRA